MTITVPIRVSIPNITDILTLYDQIKVWRSPEEDESLAIEITVGATRPRLMAGTTLYEYLDHTASITDWFQTSYLNSTTGEESPRGPLRSAMGDFTLDVVSVKELRDIFLTGIPTMNPDGTQLPDSFFRYWIKAAVGELERRLGIPIRQKIVLNEQHEYQLNDYVQLNRIKLFERPLISIQEMRIVSSGNFASAKVPLEWIRSRLSAASFQVVPTTGAGATAIVLAGGPTYLSSLNNFVSWLPGVFQVDYTAGFKKGDIPPELKQLAGMMASIEPLRIIGDLIGGVGVAGGRIGLDDLMTDTRSTKSSRGGAFQGRIDGLQKEIERLIRVYEIKFGGVSWIVA